MKLLKYIYVIMRIFVLVFIASIFGSCSLKENFDLLGHGDVDPDDIITLTIQSEKLLPHQVSTRASDPKIEAETRIGHMHVFYFNEEGKLLRPEESRFVPYAQPDMTVIPVDKTAMFEANGAGTVTVYVIANMESILSNLVTSVQNGIPYVDERELIKDDLDQLVYSLPSNSSDLLSLPGGYMPMVGQGQIELKETGMDNSLVVYLTALMARVDFSIKIAAEDYEPDLPAITLKSWSVHNLPTNTKITSTSNPEIRTNPITVPKTSVIFNNKGTINFSFYMLENLKGSYGGDASSIKLSDGTEVSQNLLNALKAKHTTVNWENELPLMSMSDIQKYKTDIAPENATYVSIETVFSSYSGETYNVVYNVYLGSNHTYDYNVRRNYQYKNDITIKDIKKSNSNEPGNYTYDARVNVSNNNGYYVSILKEREHDAHFCVTPMDVYIFKGGKLNVSLDATSEIGETPWVRMEHVPAANMEAGTPINDDCVATGKFRASNSIRKHFTTDLVTNTLKGNISFDCRHRDRIYFYIDENLSTSLTREAKVTLSYIDGDGNTSISSFDLVQVPLLALSTADGNTIYMEQFEEYLDYYDPLEDYSTDKIYNGLPWGLKGTSVEVDDIQNNYYNGLEATNYIASHAQTNSNNRLDAQKWITDVPVTAAGYCYMKNKWNGTSAVQKWFLPGITQMENALAVFYTKYDEFQSIFYWSSASGKKKSTFSYPEDINYGRAVVNHKGVTSSSDYNDENDSLSLTNISENIEWKEVPSGTGTHYYYEKKVLGIVYESGYKEADSDHPGTHVKLERIKSKVSRDIPLRIRAFRTDLN